MITIITRRRKNSQFKVPNTDICTAFLHGTVMEVRCSCVITLCLINNAGLSAYKKSHIGFTVILALSSLNSTIVTIYFYLSISTKIPNKINKPWSSLISDWFFKSPQ